VNQSKKTANLNHDSKLEAGKQVQARSRQKQWGKKHPSRGEED